MVGEDKSSMISIQWLDSSSLELRLLFIYFYLFFIFLINTLQTFIKKTSQTNYILDKSLLNTARNLFNPITSLTELRACLARICAGLLPDLRI